MHEFYEDAATAKPAEFPSYAFIEPSYLPFGQNDQHPPHDVLKGDALVASVYNALRGNSKLWASTLLVVIWDEHGGFYDHVYPPAAVAPDHHAQEGCKFDQYGVRVPAILASPWVKPGVFSHPAHGELDHTSVLRYLIEKFGLGPLTARVASAATLAEVITGDGTTVGPAAIGTDPHPLMAEFAGEPTMETLNRNQAALIDFTRQLELEMHAPPQEVGLRTLRAAAGMQGEVEVAKERVARFLEERSR
jgi:phospholipase C